jgi:hypothetical protein
MSKNLKELKEENQDDFFKELGLQTFIGYYLIPILENIENKIETLSKKVKKLEQEGSYYPRTEKEIKNIKLGGTD